MTIYLVLKAPIKKCRANSVKILKAYKTLSKAKKHADKENRSATHNSWVVSIKILKNS